MAAEAGAGMDSPLDGIRVIDLTRALAGPFCTLILAGLGAEVIKVEDPRGGDISRGNAPYIGADGLKLVATGPDDISLAVLTRLRGKRSVTLNLKHPEASGVFGDLVRRADVVVENFTSGTADRLGVGYAAARDANPAIVYCAISGFGADAEPGVRAMDTIVQALSGTMLTSGGPEDPPIRVGVPMGDVMTPVWGVVGILAALQRRQRTGRGDFVDVSMLGVLTSLVSTEDWQALADLGQPLRTGPTLPRLSPFGVYRCADGWFAMVAPQDRLVESLAEAMGAPELLQDERFRSRDARVLHDAELTAEIEAWAAGHSAEEIAGLLGARGVPVAPIRTPIEAVADPRVVARHETVPVEHPRLGEIPRLRTTGVPLRMGEGRIGFDRLAPSLGEHTNDVLAGLLGYEPERIQALRTDGVI